MVFSTPPIKVGLSQMGLDLQGRGTGLTMMPSVVAAMNALAARYVDGARLTPGRAPAVPGVSAVRDASIRRQPGTRRPHGVDTALTRCRGARQAVSARMSVIINPTRTPKTNRLKTR
jgi:hypothetical protein